MSTSGVSITEEHSLPTEPRLEEVKWRFFIDGAITRAIESMWHRVEVHMGSMKGTNPDYSPPLTVQDLERLLQRLPRGQGSDIRIHNTGGSEPPKWLSKFFLGVGAILAASAITATATVIVTVASVKTMLTDYIKSNDQRVSRVEQQTDDNTRRLDRSAGVP